MDDRTRRALHDLSRRFYEESAESFDSTRQHPWPGWRQIAPKLAAIEGRGSDHPLRILDAGCGNGRFGRFLAAATGRGLDYTGVDSSTGLIDAARRASDFSGDVSAAPVTTGTSFVTADLQDWLDAPSGALPEKKAADTYDLIVLFGVLHHIPGRGARRRLLDLLARRVAEGGLLVATWWMLHETSRFEKLRVGWAAAPDIPADDLEPGDALLGWQGRGLRYCHFPSERELADLENLPGLALDESFRSDGPSGRDNLYRLFTRPPASSARIR
ncbi:MAG: class I SAM-dependent methyltransferase [Acidobacteriota bacterium]